MVQNDNRSDLDVTRRTVLQGAGGAGVVSIAGCLGGEDSDATFQVQLEVNSDNDDRVQMVNLIAESLEETGYFETSVEDYEWNTYVQRVLDPEYSEKGNIPCIGLSGTFNPESFCDALHHSENQGQCCNLTGIADSELDEMMEDARFDIDVADDPEERARRYDEVWRHLAEKQYSSITHFDLEVGVMNTNVHGFSAYPFNESLFDYGLYAPEDEQVMWLDESAHPDDTDVSDLQEGGTLRIGMAANPASFDPPYSTDTTSSMAQYFVFESLLTSDKEGNLYPWLAEDYELVEMQDVDRTDYEEYMTSVETDENGVPATEEQIIIQHPDDDPADGEVRLITPAEAADAVADGVFGMQFRYSLHEGIEFHNGEELTAENVVASLRRYENSDMSAQTFDSVLHAEAVDEYTVDIYAQIPDAEAERELPGFQIFTTEQAELEGGAIDPREGQMPVGTGPYELVDLEDSQYIEYAKNENYWMESLGVDQKEWFDGPEGFPDGPVIDELDVRIVPDNATRSGALQNDEIDITYGLTTSTLDDYEESDDYVIDSVEAGGYEYIQYPVNVEPWNDERLRRAVNHLIPRQQIVDRVLNGWGRPAWTDIPQLAEGTGTADADALEEEIRPSNEYDPEKATELIEEVIDEYDL